MDLSDVDIKPAEGKVVLKFVDDEDDDDDDMTESPMRPDGSVEYEGCLAIVLGVGAKVAGVKKGDTVVVTPWARDGIKIGDNTHICEAWCIQATIK